MNSEIGDTVENELEYTLDEALAKVGFGKFQVLVLIYAGLGSMVEAMEVMILSFIGPSVKSEWGLSSCQESLITTMVFAGMLIGAYSWGIISDNYGRRKGLLSVAAVTSIFALLSAFAPNYISLVIFRMVAGIGLGGGPVYSAWFLEFVPVQNRGIWMVVYSSFWTIGAILEASLAWVKIGQHFLTRWLLALSSVPCFAAFLFYFLTIESPRYLYMNDRINEAYNVLKKMAEMNKTELPTGVLVFDKVTKLNDEFTHLEETQLQSAGRNKNAISKPGFSSLLLLLSPRLVKTTLLLWMIYFGNSFSYYGIVLLTSEFSSGEIKCSSASLNKQNLKDSSLYKDIFITSFAELPGLLLSAVIVENVGRKISLELMYLFSFMFLLPLMFHYYKIWTTILLFGARMFIIGTFSVAGVYCPEIYPTYVRTTGIGVASAVGRIAGMICPLVAVNLMSGCHQMAAIILFEVVIILSGISVQLLPFETKGRELTDIVAANR